MSTRSQIGVKNTDGSIEIVYCHSDGYFSHNGDKLYNFHNSEEAARKIVSLGGCSFLSERLDPKGPHGFEYRAREEGCSVFYARDRGDDGGVVDKDFHKDFEDYVNTGNHQEYAYLYDVARQAWIATDLNGRAGYWNWYLLSDLEKAGWALYDEDGHRKTDVPTVSYHFIGNEIGA